MFVGTSVRSPQGTIEVSVLIEGLRQPLYRRPWDGKVFVAGIPGEAYTLQVRNLVGGRIEVISTVDGRHTLDDEPGDQYRNRGLIISEHTTFRGWRLSDTEVREFLFGSPEQSIAAQATGSVQNIGVIGFAVHLEHRLLMSLYSKNGTPPAFPGSSTPRMMDRGDARGNASYGGSLGTGMGAVQQDRVGHTSFTRNGAEPDILAIGYDTLEVLRRNNIIAPAEADPFPGVQTGFAKYQPMDYRPDRH